jgi:flagellar protein FlgJ
MSVIPPTLHLPGTAAAQPTLSATVKHMTGMLWYNMLSELNKSGFSSDALGAGGDDFQSMFLWNIAQNDFGKYDTALTNAALRQEGGQADVTAAPAPTEAPGFALPNAALSNVALPMVQASQISDPADEGTDAGAVTQAAALSAVPENAQSAGDLVTQAKNFAKAIWPQISAAAQALGVPPVAVLAQTALETGWGSAAPGNNLFGIKAVDGEASTSRPTHEVVDGMMTPQTAAFRNYASIAASVSDYVGQIQSGFQNAVGQNTVNGFAHALQQAGYATDTNYAAKIISISQSPLMTQVLQTVGDAQGPGVAAAPNAATAPVNQNAAATPVHQSMGTTPTNQSAGIAPINIVSKTGAL